MVRCVHFGKAEYYRGAGLQFYKGTSVFYPAVRRRDRPLQPREFGSSVASRGMSLSRGTISQGRSRTVRVPRFQKKATQVWDVVTRPRICGNFRGRMEFQAGCHGKKRRRREPLGANLGSHRFNSREHKRLCRVFPPASTKRIP